MKWAEKQYSCFGMDISKHAISIAKKNAIHSNLSVANGNLLPFENDYFNIVTCFDVLEHMPAPEKALTEIVRVLSEKGYLILSTPNPNSIGVKWKGKNWHGYRDCTHVSIYETKVWINLLQDAGLTIREVFFDILWDSPYFQGIPVFLQHSFFKTLVLIYYVIGLKTPEKYGENIYIIAQKI